MPEPTENVGVFYPGLSPSRTYAPGAAGLKMRRLPVTVLLTLIRKSP
jgi:hypothetical protein